MLPHRALSFLFLSSALSYVSAVKTLSHRVKPPPPADDDPTAASTGTAYYFDQLIDHRNPSLGTFKQRYFFSDDYWTRQGAPIVLGNPGEQSADSFDTELTSSASLQRALMMSLGAAGVVLEHRYWGQSSPYQNLTTANLKYLTLDQSIEDTRYFVQHAKLPWTKKAKTSNPKVVPWINIGCSYPGVLSAYTQKRYPKLFAAAWASSAPVQAVGDFWQYFEPIEEGMPKNCSKDVGEAITHIDQILLYGSEAEKHKLKKSFGLEKLRNDDFAQALVSPIWGWQNMDPGSYAADGEDPFFQFCDAIETHSNGKISKSAKGVGMPTSLNNYAKWIRANEAASCDGRGGACYSTYDYTTDQYTDWRVDNHDGDRQWYWMVCNEFGFFQGGDPGNYSVIVSSLVTENYNIRQCNHMFPNADGSLGNFYPDTANVNAENGGGWNLRARNLFVVNGQYDPWRSASLSSIYAPKFRNTPHQRVEVIRGGHHCWDFNLDGAKYNHDIKRVVDIGVNRIKKWVKQWYRAHRHVENSMPKGRVNYWAGLL